MTTQTLTGTPGAHVEEPGPLVLAGQIADLTDQLHNALCAGGQVDDYAHLLRRLADVSSNLSCASAQVASDFYGKDGSGYDTHKAASSAEGIFGEASCTLRAASDLLASDAE